MPLFKPSSELASLTFRLRAPQMGLSIPPTTPNTTISFPLTKDGVCSRSTFRVVTVLKEHGLVSLSKGSRPVSTNVIFGRGFKTLFFLKKAHLVATTHSALSVSFTVGWKGQCCPWKLQNNEVLLRRFRVLVCIVPWVCGQNWHGGEGGLHFSPPGQREENFLLQVSSYVFSCFHFNSTKPWSHLQCAGLWEA